MALRAWLRILIELADLLTTRLLINVRCCGGGARFAVAAVSLLLALTCHEIIIHR
jgi:hypothetical protein